MAGSGRSAPGSFLIPRSARSARHGGGFHSDLLVYRVGSGVRSLCREICFADRRRLVDLAIEYEVGMTAHSVKFQSWTGTISTKTDGAIVVQKGQQLGSVIAF